MSPFARFRENLLQAWVSLGDHRLRTVLSILGITIGIAAVMAVSTVSKGGNHVVYSELETFGLNSVWVYRQWDDDSPLRQVRPGSGIDNADLAAIQRQASRLGVLRVSPIVRGDQRRPSLRHAGRYAAAEVIGVNRDYLGVVNDSVASGRSFTANDMKEKLQVAIIGPDVARKLYGNALAQQAQSTWPTLVMGHRRFQVIGVLAPKSRDFLASIGSAGGQNANDRVLIPHTTMQKIKGNSSISHLHIEVADFDNAQRSAEALANLLYSRHGGNYEYEFDTMATHIATTDRILGGVAIVGIVAASISLLVGGMGILNMMSTAVLERTREIGIRKAVGASESDIQRQFLLEAVLISLIGGMLGLLIGVAASVVLAKITGFPLIPSIITIAGALVVSIVVGVMAGFLPARRAARLHPVEALRSD